MDFPPLGKVESNQLANNSLCRFNNHCLCRKAFCPFCAAVSAVVLLTKGREFESPNGHLEQLLEHLEGETAQGAFMSSRIDDKAV